tara:strand:- start:107 stop:253 length:147 start_codon:yes stop_codon:yes gene_type:complete
MMQHHNYSLTELDDMMPWEREIYVNLLQNHIKEENERLKEQQNKMKRR